MRFKNFWEEYFFFTNNVIRYSGQPTNFDFAFPIYRVREWDDFELNRNTLQYPSKNDCKKIGRANIPYHPVFYGSYSIDCAIKEINPKNKYVLTTWEWKEEFKINAHLLSTKDKDYQYSLQQYNIMNNEDYERELIKLNKNISPGTMLGDMLDTMYAVSDLFLNEEDYFGSALIGFEELYRTRLTKKYPTTDLLIYPSVKLNTGINLAIHPEIVDNYLELKKIEIFE